MSKIITFVIAIVALVMVAVSVPSSVDARVRVRGYYRSSGTYVQPHYRTNSNSYKYDNYSYKGNYNPYTGRVGTKY